MHSEQLEVLNISNVNASGQTVLNDEKLLELIQKYPFLYNPDVNLFQDADYDEWAWNNIASELNKTYSKQVRVEPFPVPVLINRWQLLRPIILSLSKSYDINAIPSILRQHVINLSQHLEKEPPDVKPKPFNSSQDIILENIEMVERLPLIFREKLEEEIMTLILKTELESKGTGTMNALQVELECKNFLQEIGLKYQCEYVNGKKLSSNVNNLLMNDVKPDTSNEQLSEYEEMNQLLVPLDRPQWVPLDQAPLYVRNCVVRIKRLNLTPDDIPLARIKKENIW